MGLLLYGGLFCIVVFAVLLMLSEKDTNLVEPLTLAQLSHQAGLAGAVVEGLVSQGRHCPAANLRVARQTYASLQGRYERLYRKSFKLR